MRLTIAALVLTIASVANAGTYYISADATGRDWAAAQNIETPTNYVRANRNVAPGDTVLMLDTGGEYTGSFVIWPKVSGTEGNPSNLIQCPNCGHVFPLPQ